MAQPLIRRDRIPIRSLLLYGWLPSPLKKWIYRTFRRYRIGRNVRLAFGSLIEGQDVEIGDHVEIGVLAVVSGRKIRIGRHSSVGTMSYVSCRVIEIGEDARIREQVFVGGPELPESRFSLGSRTVVLQWTSINPTKPVVIGDDTGIGGHCLIFTHSSWLNVLDGYPVAFEPVTLGRSVWLPWRVFIMPGTTIGDGSVVGANSLVMGRIPACSLAVGSPAKVIRTAPTFPRKIDDAAKAELVRGILAEFGRLMEDEEVMIGEAGPFRTYQREGRTHRLLQLREGIDSAAAARGDTVLSEVPLSDAQKAELGGRGIHWLDLGGRCRSEEGGPLTEELALFLGRFGIRLPRER